jgi:hypothetical protein
VSFGTYVCKVRDPLQPYGHRINALAGCVGRYQPIGFQATFGYLEHIAGDIRHDEDALLQAITALSSSRDLWLVELSAFTKRRKAAKHLGLRKPRANEDDPSRPLCWYGDSRSAAMFAVRYLLLGRVNRGADPGAEVRGLASALLDRNGLDASELDQVGVLRTWYQELLRASGWPGVDWPNWNRARDSLWMLHLIASAAAPEGNDTTSRS